MKKDTEENGIGSASGFPVVSAILSAFFLMIGVLVTLADPGSSPIFPPCPIHHFFGVYCPGCGFSRALAAVLHGEFSRAFQFYPPIFPLMALLPLWLSNVVYYLIHRRRLFPQPMTSRFLTYFLVFFLIFGILRNLPWQAFEFLTPH